MGVGIGLGLSHPHLAQGAHGRQVGKTVGLEALHRTALMVHADQQVGADLFDVAAQGHELRAILPVAGKQNQPAHQRVLESLAVNPGQSQAGNIDDEGGVEGHENSSR